MDNKTVYIIGAGFNQFLEDFDSIKPPLANDFFIKALSKRKFNEPHFLDKISDLLDYIKRYWHFDISDLKRRKIDLEEIFTLIQLQEKEAKLKRNAKKLKTLVDISYKLENFFSEFLSDFMPFNPKKPKGYSYLLKFGKLLLKEKPTVISFNYDTLLEEAIASASGVAKPPDAYLALHQNKGKAQKLPPSLIKYSHSKWNPVLSYGFRFNYVKLPQAGLSKVVSQKEYYGKGLNELYEMEIFKLHGSLNWMEPAGPLDRNAWVNSRHFSWKDFPAQIQKEKGVIYYPGRWHFGMPPIINTWFLRPKIITPVLYKDIFYNNFPFPGLWEKALITLKLCQRLVIIGYSFPPTDFATRKLFLEGFSAHSLKELILVSPDKSHQVRDEVRRLTHFSKPICWYESVQKYLRYLEI